MASPNSRQIAWDVIRGFDSDFGAVIRKLGWPAASAGLVPVYEQMLVSMSLAIDRAYLQGVQDAKALENAKFHEAPSYSSDQEGNIRRDVVLPPKVDRRHLGNGHSKRPPREDLVNSLNDLNWVKAAVARKYQVNTETVSSWMKKFELVRPSGPTTSMSTSDADNPT